MMLVKGGGVENGEGECTVSSQRTSGCLVSAAAGGGVTQGVVGGGGTH